MGLANHATKVRPTEYRTAATGGLAGLLIGILEPAPSQAAVITAAVGVSAAFYTYLVNHEGILGIVHSVLRGGRKSPA